MTISLLEISQGQALLRYRLLSVWLFLMMQPEWIQPGQYLVHQMWVQVNLEIRDEKMIE